MIKAIFHTIDIKSLAEELINCWLTYAMSQPVTFDLPVIAIFLLEYFGIKTVWDYLRSKSFFGTEQEDELMDFDSGNEQHLSY